MKTCNRCKKEKSLDNFYQNKGTVYSMCKPCKTLHNKEIWDKKREKLKKSQIW